MRFAGFGGKKNGELLRLANSAGYQVLITVDQGIPYQQSLHGLSIALIVLAVPSNDLNTLTPMAHSILGVPEFVAAGAVVMLNCAPAGQRKNPERDYGCLRGELVAEQTGARIGSRAVRSERNPAGSCAPVLRRFGNKVVRKAEARA